jgi:hypothetical protein
MSARAMKAGGRLWSLVASRAPAITTFFTALVVAVVAVYLGTAATNTRSWGRFYGQRTVGERSAAERRWLLSPRRGYSALRMPLQCCTRLSTAPLAVNSMGGRRVFPLARRQRVARCVIVAVAIANAATSRIFGRSKFTLALVR